METQAQDIDLYKSLKFLYFPIERPKKLDNIVNLRGFRVYDIEKKGLHLFSRCGIMNLDNGQLSPQKRKAHERANIHRLYYDFLDKHPTYNSAILLCILYFTR